MIKIGFCCNEINYAGTWRSHEQIVLNLNKNEFDVYVLDYSIYDNSRIDIVRDAIGKDKVLRVDRSVENLGPQSGYDPVHSNVEEVCSRERFDILHSARSGHYEWPFNRRLCPIQIETNIFGVVDSSQFLDYSVPICNYIADKRGASNQVLYNPIPSPRDTSSNLRSELGLGDDIFVLGRIGRPRGYVPYALEAFSKLISKVDCKYIVIAPCEGIKKHAKELGIEKYMIYFEPTNDDSFIEKFHNTIDVFAHYRDDGECHSTAISQAMVYGKPVISHYSNIYNGQVETISDGGWVVSNGEEYYNRLYSLASDEELYKTISKNALKQSKKFITETIVPQWEDIYRKLMK